MCGGATLAHFFFYIFFVDCFLIVCSVFYGLYFINFICFLDKNVKIIDFLFAESVNCFYCGKNYCVVLI
jgi:hypothetical protein